MKNKVLSLFAVLTLGTVSVQPFTKANLESVMKISGVVATTPNVVKLIKGVDDTHLALVGKMSQTAYDWTSAALESGTPIEQFDRFILAIMKNKSVTIDGVVSQGNIIQWNTQSAKNAGVAVAFQLLKEVCNEVAGHVISAQLPEDRERIMRRAVRTVCISAIEGSVDALEAVLYNALLKAEGTASADVLRTFTENFLTTFATVASNQIVGELLVRECEDDHAHNLSIKDILNFNPQTQS